MVAPFIPLDIFNIPSLYPFHWLAGRKPVIHFYDANDVKIETVELSPLNNDQCLELLTSRGFKRKAAAQHAVRLDF